MVTSKGHVIFIDMSWDKEKRVVDVLFEYNTITDKLHVSIIPESTIINVLPKDELDSINVDRRELETWIGTVVHSIISKKGIHDIEENIRRNIIVGGSMERFCNELKSHTTEFNEYSK